MLNIALIGYGYWGPNLARNLHGLTDGKLAACCDLDQARLNTVQRLYPTVRVTTHLSDIWHDPQLEAVVIATPAATHFELARQALLAGKHVLVEKPLAMSSQEVEELILLADKQQRVLMVGHTFEYNPAVLKIKELLDQGQIGDVYYAYSVRVNLGRVQRDLNALWSIAPHDISILIFLLSCLPVEVSARGVSHLHDGIEDVVFATLLFPNNILAHIHASWLDPGKLRQMTLVGSQKMIVYDDVASEGKVRVYDKGVLRIEDSRIYGEFQYKLHSGDIYIPKIDLSEPLSNECAHFIECIQHNKRPRSDGLDGLRVVKVLEAAQRSLQQRGAAVEVQ